MSRRIRDSIEKLVTLTHAPVTDYIEGVSMIDLAKVGARGGQAGTTSR